ncbi:LysR family transcriptional regulator [Nocardiopsis sp. HNM0947]|uniref:LysR family transcriptional regulator n=1 Tax=Nocardiopsis coralli TaxID=2772213 RepID=A0ABR9PE44_9ACTN|nr:LysR family transcriptional regulator [Nocardiopsis coralli]MBE3002091.1 LysR family transcriptional regulator [Nocardiopsis coralli]
MDEAGMMADWVQIPSLRLLAALADSGSVGAAARRVGIAQPNASRSIAMLERRTGLRMLDRSPRGSTLTREGQLAAAWAQEVLDSLERFAAGTRALAHDGTGKLAVGASQTVAEHLAPLWISRLNRSHPSISVVLDMQNSERVIAGVVSGEYGIGFVESPTVPEHLHQAVICEDPLELVVAPDHPWAAHAARGGAVHLPELARTPLVIREAGSGTRALVDEVLEPFGPARPVSELNSTAAIIRAVRAGAGPAILSRLASADELAGGRLVPVPVADGTPRRKLRAVWTGPATPVGSAARMVETALGTGPL